MAHIIQYASGIQVPILDMSNHVHKEYCEIWNHDFHSEIKTGRPDYHPHWEKIPFISNYIQGLQNDEIVIWLDADAVIMWHYFDLSSILGENDIGMVQNMQGGFNPGMIILKNSKKIREFFWLVESHINDSSAGIFGACDQQWINQVLIESSLRVESLNKRFNNFKFARGHQTEITVVKAFHEEIKGSCVLNKIKEQIRLSNLCLQYSRDGHPDILAREYAPFSGLRSYS